MVPWGAMRACFVWWSACVAPFAATGSLFEEEMEIHAAHSVVAAAKTAKRELDAMRKAHDVAMADITSLRRLIAEDGYQVGALAEEVELAESEGLAAIADYSRLVVFIKPPTYGGEYKANATDGANATATANGTLPDPDAVAQAIAVEYLNRYRTKAEVLESVDARLEALDKKLAWLADALARSLLTDDEHAAEKAKLLAAFEAIEQ